MRMREVLRRKRARWHEVGTVLAANRFGGNNPLPPARAEAFQRCRAFLEALRQTKPLASAGTPEAIQAATDVRQGTALPGGLRAETSERLVTEGRSLESLISGSHPTGKAAEVVCASDYRELHGGNNPGIVNPPKKIARNVEDIRLSPHNASKKDLMFRFRANNGMLISKGNGQVKTGSAQYITEKLVKMANTPGYGKVGYVDARFVNADGTPRVAPDAFSQAQADRLQQARVRLRGIRDLEARSEKLVEDIRSYAEDGLDPVARDRLRSLRDDIAGAYKPRGVAWRVASGAAIAAATAALLTMVLQIATEGKVDLQPLGLVSVKSALFGAGISAADSAIYHAAIHGGMMPEVAQQIAGHLVASGLCLFAVGVDYFEEGKAAWNGDISVQDAFGGIAGKTALDLLPLVLAPLGPWSIVLLLGTQLGGRWLFSRQREKERDLQRRIMGNSACATILAERLHKIGEEVVSLNRDCDDTDALFLAMQGDNGRLFAGSA